MRYEEFTTEEQQLDEILPLIPAIAGGVARAAIGGAGRLAGKAALGLGKAAVKGVAKGVGAVARGAGKAVGTGAKTAYNAVAGDDDEPETNNPNATVGTQPADAQPEPQAAAPTDTGAEPTRGVGKAAKVPVDTDLRTGSTVDLPTKTPGGKKKYRVTRANGDDIEIEDPTAKPGEPSKMVYKKQDLQKAMSV